MIGDGERAEAAGDFLFDLGHAHGTLTNVVGEWHGWVAEEAAQQIGRDGLFTTAALPGLLCGFGMDRFPFPYQGVVDSTEGGNVTGVERALLASGRRADPVGVEQQLHHRLGQLLAGDFLYIDQFAQQVGIA